MNTKTLKRMILNKARFTSLVPTLVGPSGVGKTAIVNELGRDEGLEVLTISLASIESSDFTGRAIVEDGLTKYAKPFFLDHKGILFLDEINRAHDISVQAALHSLILDRSINGHKIPSETLLIAAGNIGKGYEVVDFDKSLNERLIKIEYKGDLESWSVYESSVRPSKLVNFFKAHESMAAQFSFRRMTEANKYYLGTNSTEGLEYILNASVTELFHESLNSKSLDTQSILSGRYSEDVIESESPMRLNMICQELSEHALNKETPQGALKNMRGFLELVRPESRLAFFSNIRKACETTPPDVFGPIADNLKRAKFFSGDFKEYLKIVFQGNNK